MKLNYCKKSVNNPLDFYNGIILAIHLAPDSGD